MCRTLNKFRYVAKINYERLILDIESSESYWENALLELTFGKRRPFVYSVDGDTRESEKPPKVTQE